MKMKSNLHSVTVSAFVVIFIGTETTNKSNCPILFSMVFIVHVFKISEKSKSLKKETLNNSIYECFFCFVIWGSGWGVKSVDSTLPTITHSGFMAVSP